jgi:hypothetical protein
VCAEAADQELRFTSRHARNGRILHVTEGAVPSLGFLPHNIHNRSVFEFVHRDDAATLFAALISGECTRVRYIVVHLQLV